MQLPSLFGDHMVLQRKRPVPVWGWSEPGVEVRVVCAGHSASAVCGDDGFWQACLPPMDPGGPHKLEVTAACGSATFEDVRIGDVWLCSGQSNMQWPLIQTHDAAQAVPAARHEEVRLFTVERPRTVRPARDVRGRWARCTPKTVREFSAVAYHFGRELHGRCRVPVGLIHSSWGGTPVESWMSSQALANDPANRELLAYWRGVYHKHSGIAEGAVSEYPSWLLRFNEFRRHMDAWRVQMELASRRNEPAPPQPELNRPKGPGDNHTPSILYDTMIAPLMPFALAGVIWYQGESNSTRACQYRRLFRELICSWRREWRAAGPAESLAADHPDPAFLFVQLANYRQRAEQPGESDWAELREAQASVLDLPATGMAVTIDVGEADDIHPRNKRDVGIRLARLAEAYLNGAPRASCGPLFAEAAVQGRAVRLRFKHAVGGLRSADGKPLRGFAIAGQDGRYTWADADIEGGEVMVKSPDVRAPVAVRYGWADNPDANLTDGAGFPAAPFRTDDWSELTRGAECPGA